MILLSNMTQFNQMTELWIFVSCPDRVEPPKSGPYLNSVLYTLSDHLRNTTTAGHRLSAVNNFLSKRSSHTSLTVQIWFPVSKYSVEVGPFELSFIPKSNLPPTLSRLSFIVLIKLNFPRFMSRAFHHCQACQSKGGGGWDANKRDA